MLGKMILLCCMFLPLAFCSTTRSCKWLDFLFVPGFSSGVNMPKAKDRQTSPAFAKILHATEGSDNMWWLSIWVIVKQIRNKRSTQAVIHTHVAKHTLITCAFVNHVSRKTRGKALHVTCCCQQPNSWHQCSKQPQRRSKRMNITAVVLCLPKNLKLSWAEKTSQPESTDTHTHNQFILTQMTQCNKPNLFVVSHRQQVMMHVFLCLFQLTTSFSLFQFCHACPHCSSTASLLPTSHGDRLEQRQKRFLHFFWTPWLWSCHHNCRHLKCECNLDCPPLSGTAHVVHETLHSCSFFFWWTIETECVTLFSDALIAAWALQSANHKGRALCCQMLICKTQSHHRFMFGAKTHPDCSTFCHKKCIVANLRCSCFLFFPFGCFKWFRCSNLSTPKAHLFPLFPPFWGPPLQKWPKGQCNLTCGPWPLALLHSTDIPHCMWTFHFFSNCGVPHWTSSPCRTAVTTGFSLGKHGSFAGGAAQVLRIRILPLKRTVNDLSGVDKIEYWNGLSNVSASFAP